MTRWTPGVRQDTPGFIGLGTPLGLVTQCVHHWIHQLPVHTTLLYSAIADDEFLSSGEPTLQSYKQCYGNRETNSRPFVVG